MIRSHPCQGCGAELARIAADRKTYPGLAIVACPACHCVSTRRAPAFDSLAKWFLRRRDAESALVGRLIGILMFALWCPFITLQSLDLSQLQQIQSGHLMQALTDSGLVRVVPILWGIGFTVRLLLPHVSAKRCVQVWATALIIATLIGSGTQAWHMAWQAEAGRATPITHLRMSSDTAFDICVRAVGVVLRGVPAQLTGIALSVAVVAQIAWMTPLLGDSIRKGRLRKALARARRDAIS